MHTPAIEFFDVSKMFFSGRKKNLAVRKLSLSIQSGEVFGFLGPNGAGKSTTIKLLLNFLKPDTGTLQIIGKKVGKEEFRHRIGYLSEFPFFYEHLTARETLLLSGRLSGLERSVIDRQISRLFKLMDLSHAIDGKVGNFSKGMKQRLGMANALIHDPEVLIFDEPMSGLDPIGRHQVKQLIAELKQKGKTIFFSSHILTDIEDLCDRIGIIHKGVLLYTGPVHEFMTQKCNLEQSFLNIIKGSDNAIAS